MEVVVDGGVRCGWWLVDVVVVARATHGGREMEGKVRGRLVLPVLAWFTWMKIIQVNLAEILAPKKYLSNCNHGLMMVISEANGLETCWAEIGLK